MVFQRPTPLPLSVRENILFGLRVHSSIRSRKRSKEDEIIEQVLQEVFLWDDLKDKLKAKATTLQLERQQKLCIARLLPLKPQIILMDEPCSALDTRGTDAIEELMLNLAGQYTILIVDNNMAQARRISDECVFRLIGEVMENSTTDELLPTQKNQITADYVEGR